MDPEREQQVAITVLLGILSLGLLFAGFLLITNKLPWLDFQLAELLSLPFFIMTMYIWLDMALHETKRFRSRDQRRQETFRDANRKRLQDNRERMQALRGRR